MPAASSDTSSTPVMAAPLCPSQIPVALELLPLPLVWTAVIPRSYNKNCGVCSQNKFRISSGLPCLCRSPVYCGGVSLGPALVEGQTSPCWCEDKPLKVCAVLVAETVGCCDPVGSTGAGIPKPVAQWAFPMCPASDGLQDQPSHWGAVFGPDYGIPGWSISPRTPLASAAMLDLVLVPQGGDTHSTSIGSSYNTLPFNLNGH